MGPACQSSRSFYSWASGDGVSASEHFKDWGERWPGCWPCASPHRLAPPPAPWDLGIWGAEARPRPASRGEERCLCPLGRWGDGAGRHPHQQPCPRAPSALCLAPSPAPGRAMGCPSPGWWAAATGAKPHRAQSHIPRRWPYPSGLACCPFQEKPHFMPTCPSSSAWGPSAASGVRLGQVTDTPVVQGPLPAVPRGWVPARSPDPAGGISVEAPSKMVRGSGPSLPQPPLFYLCFCLQIGVRSSRGAGQRSLPLGVTRRVLARVHLQSGTQPPLSPHQGLHCEMITALNPLLFYLLNLI